MRLGVPSWTVAKVRACDGDLYELEGVWRLVATVADGRACRVVDWREAEECCNGRDSILVLMAAGKLWRKSCVKDGMRGRSASSMIGVKKSRGHHHNRSHWWLRDIRA